MVHTLQNTGGAPPVATGSGRPVFLPVRAAPRRPSRQGGSTGRRPAGSWDPSSVGRAPPCLPRFPTLARPCP
ncbi:MAG: hypothetical protein AVDCRST_MAG19-1152 [uncultured Thermomicrobiales bacterium]|uniref:Uncharacterized protein n=1 Tax=uncultured Thermomicrobiales bacterium TaxID=1645740 RepID=A0A6J4UMI5_9BACT|nr:MAG: hypothetical protein AVDCRST_MAG19-1152 [uncultured Thermomicrobiales bacterium]